MFAERDARASFLSHPFITAEGGRPQGRGGRQECHSPWVRSQMSALQPQALRLPRQEGPSPSTQDDHSHERGLALAADGLDAQAGDERTGPETDKTGRSALRRHPERVAHSVSTGRGVSITEGQSNPGTAPGA